MTELEVEDVTNPRTEWVDDSCYRVNRKQTNVVNVKKNISSSSPTLPPHQPYTDNEEVRCDELCHDFDVEVTENGRFKTSIRIPQAFFAYIIGTKGSRRKKLEDETKTEISIPRGTRNTNISISGSSERSVVLARQRLEMIAFDLRQRHQMTHFVSIPLISREIKDNFNRFKELVLQEGHIDGLDETIFQKTDKIHLTIGVLVILDQFEIDEASDVLDQVLKEIIQPRLHNHPPLIIKMKGLEIMNDDPSQVDVLYAKVQIKDHETNEIIQKISDDIVEVFHQKGLMKKERDHVKLHATLINTRYRKDNDEGGSGGSSSRERRKSKRISFDARPIMAKYSNFDFGDHIFDTIHLSHRHTTNKIGYYEPIYAIPCT